MSLINRLIYGCRYAHATVLDKLHSTKTGRSAEIWAKRIFKVYQDGILTNKTYFSVKDEQLYVSHFNFFQRLVRCFGGYSATHRENFTQKIYPLTLKPNAISAEHQAALQNFLGKDLASIRRLINTTQEAIEKEMNPIKVKHFIHFQDDLFLKPNEYHPTNRKDTYCLRNAKIDSKIMSENKAQRVINYLWHFNLPRNLNSRDLPNYMEGSNQKFEFQLSIKKINNNTFLFTWFERWLYEYDNRHPDRARGLNCCMWAADQVQAILTKLACELREEDINIFYVSYKRLHEQIPLKKNLVDLEIFNRIGLQFEQEIVNNSLYPRTEYVSRFVPTNLTTAIKVKDMSLAFNLGFKAASAPSTPVNSNSNTK